MRWRAESSILSSFDSDLRRRVWVELLRARGRRPARNGFPPDHDPIVLAGRPLGGIQNLEDVFVSAVPKEAGGAGTPGKWQISVNGGAQPLWRGKEIFYVAPDGKLMTVTVEVGDGVRVGTPTPLFDSGVDGTEFARFRQYDVAPDGKRFLMREDVNAGRESPLTVMLNWERLIP